MFDAPTGQTENEISCRPLPDPHVGGAGGVGGRGNTDFFFEFEVLWFRPYKKTDPCPRLAKHSFDSHNGSIVLCGRSNLSDRCICAQRTIFKRVVARRAVYHTLNVISPSVCMCVRPYV